MNHRRIGLVRAAAPGVRVFSPRRAAAPRFENTFAFTAVLTVLPAMQALALCALLVFSGCALLPRLAPPPLPPAMRISDFIDHGTPKRRASTRLVLLGLEAGMEQRTAEALGFYDRALQLDPNNPMAYLALARHEIFDGSSAEQALVFLDQAETMLGREVNTPSISVHLAGLRGAALAAVGDAGQAAPYLRRAREGALVWSDGVLSAAELR